LGRLVFFATLHLLGWGVLRALWGLSGRRAWLSALAYAGLGALAGVSWAVPPGGWASAWKGLSAAWTVGVIGVVGLGGGWLALRRLGRWWARRAGAEGVDESRRALLGLVGRGIPAAAVATGAVGVAAGVSGFVVRRETVRIPGLAPAFQGFRIGQITDVHVGPFVDTEYLRRAVEAMNEAGCDLHVMTGDLIDDLEQLPGTMAALAATTARHGLWAVLGNHEHWRGARAVVRAYEAIAKQGAKVRLLVDESAAVEHAGARLELVGVDFPMVRRPFGATKQERMLASVEKAFREVTAADLVLCLAHHPDFFDHASARGAHLTLAGHTHGGQVGILGLPVLGFAFKYMVGRFQDAGRHLYVSRGTGHWMPFRIGMPAEVTILTLEAS
jgi:predicted MPP superfamily phosphohydrolase